MWAEIADFSDNQVQEILGKTADEIGAEKKLQMVNFQMEDGTVVDSMDDDHHVYIDILQTADPSPIKDKALENRYKAIQLKEKELSGMTGQN